MEKLSLIIILTITNLIACNDDKNYHADDIEIFKNTPVWKLAQAIYNHNTEDINELLEKHPDWVNYKEPKFEISSLYWTFYNSPYDFKGGTYYEEAKILIQYGADPYYVDAENETPIMSAAKVHSENVKFIKLCLDSKHTQQLSDSLKRNLLSEALIAACGKIKEEVEGVKLLVEAGADINYFNTDSTETPVSESLIQDNIKIARYLIVERGAKFDYSIKFEVDKTDWSVLKILKDLDFSENSEEYKIKQEILAHIKEQEK